MNHRITPITALSAVVFAITLHAAHGATLTIGDPAPKLQVSKWIQGEPVK